MIAPENRGPALAAAIILLVFGLGGFFLPTIMLAVGERSTTLAGIIAVAFVLAFFGLFWWRGKSQERRRRSDR
jgi:hypothetical protein